MASAKLADSGIIRNRLKVQAAIFNAQQIRQLQQQYGSFHQWLEQHQPAQPQRMGRPVQAAFQIYGQRNRGRILAQHGLPRPMPTTPTARTPPSSSKPDPAHRTAPPSLYIHIPWCLQNARIATLIRTPSKPRWTKTHTSKPRSPIYSTNCPIFGDAAVSKPCLSVAAHPAFSVSAIDRLLSGIRAFGQTESRSRNHAGS